MKKIILSFAFVVSTLIGFSQSVTILPTSTLGGGSQWITSGNNLLYGVNGLNNVGIGTSNPFYPLVVRGNTGANDSPVIQVERSDNRTPYQSFVKFGGTNPNVFPITPGEMGLISFGGSTGTDFGNWGYGASIRAVARGIFSNTNTPGQLEFATTPASSASGPLTRMTITEEGKIGINNNTPIAQLDLRYDGSSFHSVHNPMLNIKGPDSNPIFVRYSNSSTTNFSIVQEATPSAGLNSSNIKWRWYDNSSPSQGTTLFEWTNNVFNITGALNATGNTTFGGTNTTTGASSLRGKVTVGTTTTSGNGLEIQSSSTNSASPDIYIKSPNNIIRYGGISGNAGMMQSVINSATPGSASMAWVHLDNAATPTQTTMMTLDGEGDLTVAGFAKIGGFGADVPAVKTKILTGNMPSAATTIVSVAHGLTASKIIEARVMVTGFGNITVSDNYTPTVVNGGTTYGYLFNTNVDTANINIVRNTSTTSSSNGIVTAGGVTASYKIYVTYIQ